MRIVPVAVFPPVTAYIALGANLGDRELNIQHAIELLRATAGVEVLQVSTLFENPAVGGPTDSPPFLNAAAKLRTTLEPHALLQRLLAIEKLLGRSRRVKWEPRPIDLDLLLYADHVLKTPQLTVPHPLMHERVFVLAPLSEIAPDVVHPIIGSTIAQLRSTLASRTETG